MLNRIAITLSLLFIVLGVYEVAQETGNLADGLFTVGPALAISLFVTGAVVGGPFPHNDEEFARIVGPPLLCVMLLWTVPVAVALTSLP